MAFDGKQHPHAYTSNGNEKHTAPSASIAWARTDPIASWSLDTSAFERRRPAAREWSFDRRRTSSAARCCDPRPGPSGHRGRLDPPGGPSRGDSAGVLRRDLQRVRAVGPGEGRLRRLGSGEPGHLAQASGVAEPDRVARVPHPERHAHVIRPLGGDEPKSSVILGWMTMIWSSLADHDPLAPTGHAEHRGPAHPSLDLLGRAPLQHLGVVDPEA